MHLSPAAVDAAIRLLEPSGIAHARGDIIVEKSEDRSGSALSWNYLSGVGDGFRTRDFLSHSQALYP
jgi:hypothetical protein